MRHSPLELEQEVVDRMGKYKNTTPVWKRRECTARTRDGEARRPGGEIAYEAFAPVSRPLTDKVSGLMGAFFFFFWERNVWVRLDDRRSKDKHDQDDTKIFTMIFTVR